MSQTHAETLLGEEPFHLGDAVTHTERGLAELVGLAPGLGGEGELIRLRFHGDEDVLLPVSEAGHLYDYGARADFVTLDHADGDWESVRAETEAQMRETAEKVLAATEKRRAMKAPVIEPDVAKAAKVAAGFGHELTEDQEAALGAVMADLASGTPMDRVLVADTGYGKTEVALRAAAAAVAAGYQVALACPTTVLCRQHAELFKQRLEAIGARVVRLSGMDTQAEHDAALEAMARGEADVAVGTHALVQDGVRFARLGLLITDEEQRFGAEHKQVLRRLGEGVHVLVLTATPIPRTLAAAEAGLRDLSVIRTPPAARLDAETHVAKASDDAVRKALQAEAKRGGQSFVVCPRISQLEAWSDRLAELVPDLAVAVAHGDMPAREVEAAMARFAGGEADVLLSTAIVESGVDVPRANTMLVMDATRFGLAQLHQLRGRVGRADQRAEVWLLTEGEVSGEAAHRLETLQRLSHLGAGFAVAARDLGQRGSGELFGDEQTGHLNRLGLGLARELMARALAEARGEPVPRDAPEIGACDTGFIPADYVEDEVERLRLYVRIERMAAAAAARALRRELEAAHGALPRPVADLFRGAQMRALCRRAGVAEVEAGPGGVAVRFDEVRREDERTGEQVGAASERFGEPAWSKGRLVWKCWDQDAEPCDAARDLLSVLAGEE